MADFRAGLFDLDGTVLDSMGMWADIDRRFFEKRGMELPADYFAGIAGLSFYEVAVHTKRRFSLPDTEQMLMDEWNKMAFDEYAYRIKAKPGAAEYIMKLKSEGVRLAVVTTLSEDKYTPCLKRLGIYDLFEAFVSTDQISSRKSDGYAYTFAAGRLNVLPRDCMVFEDIPEGIKGAVSAGMKACLVYDSASAERQDEGLALAHKYIKDWRYPDGHCDT